LTLEVLAVPVLKISVFWELRAYRCTVTVRLGSLIVKMEFL
jgi:hypothetical protein